MTGRRNSIGSGQTFACGFQYHPTWNTILIKPDSYALGQVFSSKQRYLELFVSMFSPSPELTGIIVRTTPQVILTSFLPLNGRLCFNGERGLDGRSRKVKGGSDTHQGAESSSKKRTQVLT